MSESTNKPTHKVFAILPRGEDKKDFWTEIGAAWENADGSLNERRELNPTDPNVTVQIRRITDDE